MHNLYECFICSNSLERGQMVVPVYRVLSAVYLVEIDPDIQHYAHVDCMKA